MPCFFVSYEGTKQKKKKSTFNLKTITGAVCINLIRRYLASPLLHLLDQDFVWRHPYPRCPLLDQQASGRGKKWIFKSGKKTYLNFF